MLHPIQTHLLRLSLAPSQLPRSHRSIALPPARSQCGPCRGQFDFSVGTCFLRWQRCLHSSFHFLFLTPEQICYLLKPWCKVGCCLTKCCSIWEHTGFPATACDLQLPIIRFSEVRTSLLVSSGCKWDGPSPCQHVPMLEARTGLKLGRRGHGMNFLSLHLTCSDPGKSGDGDSNIFYIKLFSESEFEEGTWSQLNACGDIRTKVWTRWSKRLVCTCEGDVSAYIRFLLLISL